LKIDVTNERISQIVCYNEESMLSIQYRDSTYENVP